MWPRLRSCAQEAPSRPASQHGPRMPEAVPLTLLSSLPCSQASQHGSNLWGSASVDKSTFPQAPTWHFRAQSMASLCLYFPTRESLFFKTCPRTSPCLTPVSRELAPHSSCSPLHFRKMLLQRALGAATLVLSKTGRHSGLPPQGGIWLHPSPTPPPAPTRSRVLGTSFLRPLRPHWATSVLPQPSQQLKSRPGRKEGYS